MKFRPIKLFRLKRKTIHSFYLDYSFDRHEFLTTVYETFLGIKLNVVCRYSITFTYFPGIEQLPDDPVEPIVRERYVKFHKYTTH